MRVYGLDFTSNPTTTKRLTLAKCTFEDSVLSVDSLIPLNSRAKGDFRPFEDWLNGRADWANGDSWIAGLDFPFGMPIETIDHFQWLPSDTETQSWENYLRHLYQTDDPQKFREIIEGWRHPTRKGTKGDPVRIRKQRLTDKLGNSGSPMNYFPPPVCPMFFQGARRLRDAPSTISLLPVRPVEGARYVVVEAYPRLVANVFIDRKASYKDKSKKKHTDPNEQTILRKQDETAKAECREQIITGLASTERTGRMQSRYGFRLDISRELADECVNDKDGDKLDSVLCAVQAAWAFNAPNHGMPEFTVHAMQERVRLEGWISDPFILQRLRDGDG